MAVKHARPLSPHLSIWKPGVHMFVSILNRVMGVAMATAGTLTLVAWLVALASGEQVYGAFMDYAKGLWGLGVVVAAGLSFAFYFHMLAGIRHFVMDAGAGFELKANRLWAWMTLFGAAVLTAGTWLIVVWKAL
jgi:succinate dehydrogenase / fumarate reductase cytochrome b subunit